MAPRPPSARLYPCPMLDPGDSQLDSRIGILGEEVIQEIPGETVSADRHHLATRASIIIESFSSSYVALY